VGEEGEDYEVEDYGGEKGFALLFKGLVWEIFLGKVVARHYGHGHIVQKGSSPPGELPEGGIGDRNSNEYKRLSDSSLFDRPTGGAIFPTNTTTPTTTVISREVFNDFRQHNELMFKESLAALTKVATEAFQATRNTSTTHSEKMYTFDEIQRFMQLKTETRN